MTAQPEQVRKLLEAYGTTEITTLSDLVQAAYALGHEAARADALIIWHMYSCPFSTCAICRKIADDHHRRLRLSYGHDHTQKLEAAIARSEARE